MRGKIIVIEGTDCSGKETQSLLLEKRLKKERIKCVRFDFPNYDSPTGKIIKQCYLGNDSLFEEGPTKVDPYISCLYYAADRKYNIPKIEEYLDLGYYVIIDRYTTSNMAHQGCKIKNADERFNMYHWIDKLEFWLLRLPKPDKTYFLHVPYKFVNELSKNREYLDDNEKSEEYLMNAEKAYIELSELYNWDTIECVSGEKLKSIEEINEEIYQKVKEYIEETTM